MNNPAKIWEQLSDDLQGHVLCMHSLQLHISQVKPREHLVLNAHGLISQSGNYYRLTSLGTLVANAGRAELRWRGMVAQLEARYKVQRVYREDGKVIIVPRDIYNAKACVDTVRRYYGDVQVVVVERSLYGD